MKQYIYFFLLFCAVIIECRRSPFRKIDPRMPMLITSSQKNPDVQFTHSDWFYYRNPIFTAFCETDLFSNIVQEYSMTNRFENNVTLPYDALNDMLETLIAEVNLEKNLYTHFTLLQNKNFNRKKKCGLIVLKFKDYPFVAKLFMEHPDTLLNPFCKGFENRMFHFMGHGANRHVAGLTRIPNLKRLQKMLQKKDYHVILPRKWFWLPQDPEWIEVTGYNVIPHKTISMTVPGTYVIIADELKINPEYQTIPQSKSNKIVMDFCNNVNVIIDPHSNNFIVQRDLDDTVIIALVDTEHFPTLVGISEGETFSDHVRWYLSLAWKSVKDLFMTSKQDHLTAISA